MASATLLGTGTGTDTLTITLTAATPGAGQIQVVFAETSINAGTGPGGPVGASDPSGTTWVTTAFADANSWPLIGLIKQTNGSYPHLDQVQAGSVARGCSAGDLGIGDSITVDFRDGTTTTSSVGLVVYVPDTWGHAIGQLGGFGAHHVLYANGDNYPDLASSSSRLDWDADFIGPVKPDEACWMLTAMAGYGGPSSFTPDVGTLVGSISSGGLFVASAIADAAASTDVAPGGSFNAAGSHLVGNYQFLQLGAAGIHAWQRL